MDYVSHRIGEAADYIFRELVYAQRAYEDGKFENFGGFNKEFAISNYGSRPEYESPKTMLKAYINYLTKAYETVEMASIYTHRIEWLTSGDDTIEDLLPRTEENCRELVPVNEKLEIAVRDKLSYPGCDD